MILLGIVDNDVELIVGVGKIGCEWKKLTLYR